MNKYKIYLINLDKDRERLAFMEKQFLDLGLTFERFSAIYGKDLSAAEIEKSYDDKMSKKMNGKSMTLGEVGCALSHKRVYERFLQDRENAKKQNIDLKYCIVLEDDVKLPKNFKKIIEDEMRKNEKNKKWEYLLFDHPEVGFYFVLGWLRPIRIAFHLQPNFFKKLKFILITPFKLVYISLLSFYEGAISFYLKNIKKEGDAVFFFRDVYFAGAYLVSFSGIEKLLKTQYKIVYPADRLPNEAKKSEHMKSYAYLPNITKQQRSIFGSSILGITGEEFKKGENFKKTFK